MKTSDNGLNQIILREGKRNKAYQDTKGIWTIGVGHTGSEVHSGLIWTDAQIKAQLANDIQIAEHAVNSINVTLTQNQFDALVSLTFNIGVHAFLNSTVVSRLKLKNYRGARSSILLWNKPPEIKSRRRTEYLQFGDV